MPSAEPYDLKDCVFMTAEDVDSLLERFDQTEPSIQRRIVAKLIDDRNRLYIACMSAFFAISSHGPCKNNSCDDCKKAGKTVLEAIKRMK
jgi:hypothetical protein